MNIGCNLQTAMNFALSAGIAWLVQRIPIVEEKRALAAAKKSFMLVAATRKSVDNLDPCSTLFLPDSPDITSHPHAILAFVKDSFDVTERELQEDTERIFRCIATNRNEFQTLSVDLIQIKTIMVIATVAFELVRDSVDKEERGRYHLIVDALAFRLLLKDYFLGCYCATFAVSWAVLTTVTK